MALARCEMHGKPTGETGRYFQSAKPLDYPDSTLVCGRKQCVHIAVVWLDEDDAQNYASGQRDSELSGPGATVRVEWIRTALHHSCTDVRPGPPQAQAYHAEYAFGVAVATFATPSSP